MFQPIVAVCLLLVAMVPAFSCAQSAGLLCFPTYRERDNPALATSPHLIGTVITMYWSDVEPVDGKYDWTTIDKRIEVWTRANKKVALRIMWSSSGMWPEPAAQHPTPLWVLAKGAVIVRAEKSRTEVPLVWDPVYRRYAIRFMQEVARKFDGSPDVLFVDVTPGAETNPYRMRTISQSEPDFEKRFCDTPASDGRKYSDELWLETVKRVDDAAGAFRKTRLLVTLNRGALAGPSRMQEIGDYCVSKGLMVGQNGLNGRTARDGRSPFIEWGRKSGVYYEMLDATSRGTTGSLMEVMQAAERVGCSYVGVYAADILKAIPGEPGYSAEQEKALAFGAGMLARKAGH